ncbi:hypothetical protein SAMN06298216_3200 [Spirosomataceae bacterium TFI 002]|nr:hypothetical protein SAMN06298216_3200 [Spirosomataceae bacterium TFI 002]
MKKTLVILFSLVFSHSFSQSVTISPGSTFSSSETNNLILGTDTLLSNNHKIFINNNTPGVSPSISILNNYCNPLQANWSLHSAPEFYGMKLNLSSLTQTNSKPTFSIKMPEGSLNISNTGDLQLGYNNNDTSKVNLSIRNKAAKVAISNSGAAIGLAQEVHSVVTDAKLNEVHGLYSYTDSAMYVNNSVFAETGRSGIVANIGLFGRVFNAPQYNTALSMGIYGQDDVNFPNTFAGFFNGKVHVQGNLNVVGTLSKSAGAFRIDHPLDPYNKVLMHSFVESPEMINMYNGTITTNSDSLMEINLPDYFEALNKDPHYQLTVIGQFANAIIKEPINNNRFVIQTDKPNVTVSWQVIGTRKDVYAMENPITTVTDKTGFEAGNLLYQPRTSPSGGMGMSNSVNESQNQLYKGTVKF